MATVHLTNAQLDQVAAHRASVGNESLDYPIGSLVTVVIDKWHRLDSGQIEAVDCDGGPLAPLYKVRCTHRGYVFHAFAHQIIALD